MYIGMPWGYCKWGNVPLCSVIRWCLCVDSGLSFVSVCCVGLS